MTYLSRMGILGKLAIASTHRNLSPIGGRLAAVAAPARKPVSRHASTPANTLADGTTLRQVLIGLGVKGKPTAAETATGLDIMERLRQEESRKSL
jgi:hypothetical protein